MPLPVASLVLTLNEEEARRTDIARAGEACASEAIDDPQLGAMLFCDHMEHTRTCNAALASVVLPAAVAVHS